MNTRLSAVAVTLLLANAAASAQAVFRGDSTHAGVFATQGPRKIHRVAWTFTTGGRVVSSPTYADGTLFFGGDDGGIYAVDAASGRQIWRRATGGPVPASPAVSGGTVYAPSYDGKF